MELQERTNSLRDYINMVKRRKTQMWITFLSLIALTLLITFLIPSSYRSTATILLEEQEVSDELAKQQSTTEYADARVFKVQQRALTSVNLSQIIEEFELYRDDINRLPRSEIIESMREDIRQELVSADVIDPRSGRPTRVTIAFDLSFDHRNAVMAQKVANRLVDLYRTENASQGLSSVNETEQFYSEQVEKTNREVLDLEDRLARFKAENDGALPEFIPMIMQLMQKTEKDAADAQRQLTALEERRIFLQSSLMQTDPYSGGNPQFEAITNPRQQIDLVKGQLRTARATYGNDHPDVKRLQRQLDTLIAEAGGDSGQDLGLLNEQIQEAEAMLVIAKQDYSDEHPEVKRLERQLDALKSERTMAASTGSRRAVVTAPTVRESINVRADASTDSSIIGSFLKGEQAELLDSNAGRWAKIRLNNGVEGFVAKSLINQLAPNAPAEGEQQSAPTNPAYINLQANLANVESQMRSLLGTMNDLNAKAEEFSSALTKAPLVEREYSAIMRDLVDRRALLQTYKQELERARFGVDVIMGQKGQKFTLIEPPIAPTSPHSPNRIAILFLGLVLSVFGTVAAAVVAESLDSAVRKAADILDVSGTAPLASIPVITNQGDEAKSRRNWVIGGAVSLAALLLVLGLVHFLYQPLDVLWFRAARRFGF